MRLTVPTEDLRARLADAADVAVWDLAPPAPWPAIDLVVLPYMGSIDRYRALESVDVGLAQSQSIGYDGVFGVLPARIPFANAATVHEGPAAEQGMALLLAAQRDLPRFVRQQASGTWARDVARGLAGLRVVVLGAGGLGGALADRLEPFGARVVRVARSARVDPRGEVHALADLPSLLPDADVLAVCLPLDDATRGLVDARVLAALPDGALVLNIGRGPIVDTEALVAELSAGRLRAALDVTDPEPLPAEHPLWALALVSPHVGGLVSTMPDAVEALVRRQLVALAEGRAPENLIPRS